MKIKLSLVLLTLVIFVSGCSVDELMGASERCVGRIPSLEKNLVIDYVLDSANCTYDMFLEGCVYNCSLTRYNVSVTRYGYPEALRR